jgi:hypothetical protein
MSDRTMKARLSASQLSKKAIDALKGKIEKEGYLFVAGLSPSKRKRRQPSMPKMAFLSNRPTPERIAKIAEGIELANGTRAYRVRSSLSAAEERLTEDEISVARVFVQDYLKAEAGAHQRVTAELTGMPASAKGPRQGGVVDHARPAFNTMAASAAAMDPRFWTILERIAVGVRREIDGRGWSLEEIGRQFMPRPYANEGQNRALAVGLLKAALWRMGEFYRARRARRA